MPVRLTTLAENTAAESGMLGEHGLCILVEAHGRRVLLDSGQTHTAVHNARALGVDLTRVDAIVLSHGHVDHTGGLKEVLREVCGRGREIPVYAHPDIWASRYALREGRRPRFTGIPHRQEELETLGARFHLAAEPRQFLPGMWTTGEVPRVTGFEALDDRLKVRRPEGWRQDEIADDQALVVQTANGLVVVLGCAHSGIVNTLVYAQRFTGESRIFAVVGGTHLGPGAKEQLEPTISALKGFAIERLGVSHCTGLAPAARLAQEFGASFFFNNAGSVVDLA